MLRTNRGIVFKVKYFYKFLIHKRQNGEMKMKRFLQLNSIKTKMLLGFSFIIVLVIALSVYNFVTIKGSNNDTKEMIEEQLQLLIADEKIAYNTSERLAELRGYLLFNDEVHKENFNALTEESERYQEKVLELNGTDEVKQLIDETVEWRELIYQEVFNEYDRGKEEVALRNLQEKVVPVSMDLLSRYEE